MGQLARSQRTRNDADDLSPCGEGCIGESTHESHRAAPVYQAQLALYNLARQPSGSLGVLRAKSGIRSAEDTDALHAVEAER